MIGAEGGLQGVQPLAPAVLTDPASHIEHEVAPVSLEKLPALHCTHTLDEDADGLAE